ncbi:uncharacterized protein EV420DRAFT_1572267 [Desarmillaria tabescens]|uniref:Secreted protein n=1 Tax=Armillaria tabescens TaxID=1929756 RepID=A0AA39MTJ7_ARMTA|nr:uncharacterized protein EV420DRAFT_1572267 [Desarmillaria tabescens]KAK0445295.1 hypothetical protein EV420DRAFT_1572267 [Desarmillaria tabescens]
MLSSQPLFLRIDLLLYLVLALSCAAPFRGALAVSSSLRDGVLMILKYLRPRRVHIRADFSGSCGLVVINEIFRSSTASPWSV